MRGLLAATKKEIMEASRTKKIFVLSAMAMFFGILDPVMLKMMPYILKQVAGADMSALVTLSQVAEVPDFHQDIYQIFTIVLVIVLAGLWTHEIKERTLVLPVLKGAKVGNLLIAKALAYSMIVIIILAVVYSVNYVYSGLLFGFGLDYNQVIYAALMMGAFYSFCIFMILFMSTFAENNLVVIILSLAIIYAGPFLVSLLKISKFTPFALLTEAGSFPRMPNQSILVSIISSLLILIIMTYSGLRIAERKEVVKYR
jgi:hypothetical protein